MTNEIPFDQKDTDISESDFLKMCSKIGPSSIQSYWAVAKESHAITYMDHMRHVRDEVRRNADKLFMYMPHLDSELIRLVNEILHCSLMRPLDSYFALDSGYSGEKEQSFDRIGHALYDFYKKSRDLRKFRGKESIWEGAFRKKK